MDERIALAGKSDVGKVRENQEDAWRIIEPTTGPERRRRGRLLVAADGVGGSLAGEVASGLAVATLAEIYTSSTEPPRAALRRAIQEANSRILAQAEQTPECRGMGSTIVAAVIRGDHLTVAWLGDSRAYLAQGKSIIPITRDHRASPMAGGAGLTRCLGLAMIADPDIRELSLHPGDRVLICTDGLHNLVSEEEMLRAASADPARWVEDLVQLALRRGAPDNVTAVACCVERLPFAPHRYPEPDTGSNVDGLPIAARLGEDAFDLWYRVGEGNDVRLLRVLRPELQADPGLVLEMEEEEECLASVVSPALAVVERKDAEKSLAYVCVRLPDAQGSEIHCLDQVMRAPVLGGQTVRAALSAALDVATALAAVRESMLPAGAPHPSDFWGDGYRYLLCRWPSERRQYATTTGRGMQANPLLSGYVPPDFSPGDGPSPAGDAYFAGCILTRLLGDRNPEREWPDSVNALLAGLLASRASARPDAAPAIHAALEALEVNER